MSVISPWYQLGYVIPHLYTDLDAYQFYRVAPEGMMLVTTGLNLKEYSLAAVEQELPVLRERFGLLAKKKVDRISLSGVPVAAALGRTKMREILAEGEARTGLACDTDLEAHIATLQHLGARRIALRYASIAGPFSPVEEYTAPKPMYGVNDLGSASAPCR